MGSSRAAQPGELRDGPDRRRYLRAQAPFFCRPAGVEFFAQRVEPVDVSFGGLRIYSDEEHAVGALVRLDIFVPRTERATLAAEVMWVKTTGRKTPRFEVGLAFVELNAATLTFLRSLLDPEGSPASPRPKEDGAAPADGSVSVVPDEPVSEVRPAPGNATEPAVSPDPEAKPAAQFAAREPESASALLRIISDSTGRTRA